MIHELLPARESGYRYSNSDPVTGQAAWYDLRVRIERVAADEQGESAPQFGSVRTDAGLGGRPALLRYGAEPRIKEGANS